MEEERFWRKQRLLFVLVIIAGLAGVAPAIYKRFRPHQVRERPAVGSEAINLRSIDINRAPASRLETLPGIGPSLAREIIEERRRGPFRSIADLERVRGIGPAKARLIEPYLIFSP